MSWEDDEWDVPDDVQEDSNNQPAFSDDDQEVVESDKDEVFEQPRSNPNKTQRIVAKKKSKKEIEKQKEEIRRLEEEAALKSEALTEEEKMAEKLRIQKLVEEQDNKLTEELFSGGISGSNMGTEDNEGTNHTRNVGAKPILDTSVDGFLSVLNRFDLKKFKDYKNFAEAVAKRIELDGKDKDVKEFMKDIVRHAGRIMNYEDLAEVENVLAVVKNTKVKKTLTKKKKKAGKPTIKMERGGVLGDSAGGGYDKYADYDQYDDFM
eukprot:maker-scaffold_7-snap-gene-10.28-mRNA-1 protein AED:0.02 eAED:0.02 QI:150/1/1/1/1/1/4/104/263